MAIRVDASTQIGTGHVMRCLTLADELKKRRAKVSFICRKHQGHMCSFIEGKGYPVFQLPWQERTKDFDAPPGLPTHDEGLGTSWEEDAAQTMHVLRKETGVVDWLIADHYAIDQRWETRVRTLAAKVMVIDDLANRHHECELLLDQNFYRDMNTRYLDKIPQNCHSLLGPRYALLREEFLQAARNLRERDGHVHRILFFFGGSDPTNETVKALDALRLFNRRDVAVDVIIGETNQFKDIIQAECTALSNVSCHIQVDNMAELMSRADLALGAGGSATWERCFLGLPTITIMVADNQLETTLALAQAGAIKCLGTSLEVSAQTLASAISEFVDNACAMKTMSKKCLSVMGGNNFQGARGVAGALWEGPRQERSY